MIEMLSLYKSGRDWGRGQEERVRIVYSFDDEYQYTAHRLLLMNYNAAFTCH